MKKLNRKSSDFLIALAFLIAVLIVWMVRKEQPTIITWEDVRGQGNEDTTAEEWLDKQMIALHERDPVSDAQENYRQKNIFFYGASGIVVYRPGLSSNISRASEKYPAKVIAGTSDYLRNGEQVKLNDLACQFAAAYNIEMVKLLQRDGLLPEKLE